MAETPEVERRDWEDWPADLIAFKWANTLPREIQDKLLTEHLAHLQLAVNHAVKQARSNHR